VPSWDWHRLGVDLARQRAIRAAATVAARLEECVYLTPAEASARLRIVPGIGEWTAAEVAQRAWGDPDAVSVGDYHIHDQVVHALTGRPRGDDAEMLELLERWRGHRQRVVRLIEVSGVAKPRFGPRYSPIDMRAM
jgi:3-methyladenine DNA glycosylase/8-oxoguanine DNA glycosylase